MSDRYIPGVLSLDEAETLVRTCYYNEMAAIKSARYRRSTDKARDMGACNAALAAAEALLNRERLDEAFTDREPEEARQTIWQYVRGGLRNGIENIRNMTLRQQYIAAIGESAKAMRDELANAREELKLIEEERARFTRMAEAKAPTRTVKQRLAREQRVRAGLERVAGATKKLNSKIARIARDATTARNNTLNLTRAKLSKTARAFSRWVKENGLSYQQLVNRYTQKAQQARRIRRGTFRTLSLQDKIIVFDDIIVASGRANATVTKVSRSMGVMGSATIILILGCVVWDVVESSNPTLTFVKDAVTVGAGLAGAELGAELGAAVAAAGGPLGVFVGGVLGGIIGGLGIGLAATSLFDAMTAVFSDTIPTELSDHKYLRHSMIYVPVLPDGSALSTALFPSQPA